MVSTSLLATAVQDLVGGALAVETLMPAGTCPGQYDLTPDQARRIRLAQLVLRHERQGFLDARCQAAGVATDAIAHPSSPGLWTVPSVYERYSALIADEILRRWPTLQPTIKARQVALSRDLAELATTLRASAAPLRGTRVLAAQFQAEFLTWLGLDVIGTFPPADDPPPAVLRTAIQSARQHQATLVVGNLQSGERLPLTLAQAAGLPCAMLSNFPASSQAGALAPLLQDNVRRLLVATRGEVTASPPAP